MSDDVKVYHELGLLTAQVAELLRRQNLEDRDHKRIDESLTKLGGVTAAIDSINKRLSQISDVKHQKHHNLLDDVLPILKGIKEDHEEQGRFWRKMGRTLQGKGLLIILGLALIGLLFVLGFKSEAMTIANKIPAVKP